MHDIHFFFILLLLDSGHGGQTKDLDGDEADGFDEGYSTLFKWSILVNTNDVYSYLSCKLCDTDVPLTYMLIITDGFRGKWPHCRRCKFCLHIYYVSLILSLSLCIK